MLALLLLTLLSWLLYELTVLGCAASLRASVLGTVFAPEPAVVDVLGCRGRFRCWTRPRCLEWDCLLRFAMEVRKWNPHNFLPGSALVAALVDEVVTFLAQAPCFAPVPVVYVASFVWDVPLLPTRYGHVCGEALRESHLAAPGAGERFLRQSAADAQIGALEAS
jgi:hypothetical protein